MMMFLIRILIVCCVFSNTALAQVEWVTTIGGSLYDYPRGLRSVPGLGFVVVGATQSYDLDFSANPLKNPNNANSFVTVLDSTGTVKWTRILGSPNGGTGANDADVLSDNGLVVVGGTYIYEDGDFAGLSRGGVNEIFAIRYNVDGSIAWKRTFGGSGYEAALSIAGTKDSGWILGGFTSSNDNDFAGLGKGSTDGFLMKIDANGRLEWLKVIGGKNRDNVSSVAVCPDGSFLVVGETESSDGSFEGRPKRETDAFVAKYRPTGSLEWLRTFGGSSVDGFASVVTTPQNEIIISGTSNSRDGDLAGLLNGFSNDAFVIKLNSAGTQQWFRGLVGREYDRADGLALLNDGNIALCGATRSRDGDFSGMGKSSSRAFLAMLNGNGDVVSMREFGGSRSEDDGETVGLRVVGAQGDRVVLAGETTHSEGDFQGLQKGVRDVFVLQTCATIPATPRHSQPPSGATDVDTTVRIAWREVPCAEFYELEVARDYSAGAIVVDTVLAGKTECTIDGLAYSTVYAWRVRATATNGVGAWSTASSFTTTAPTPASVILKYPEHKSQGIASTVTLKWLPSKRATLYLLDIATDSVFAAKVVNGVSVVDPEYTVTLSRGTRYYWRVRAGNASGATPWSSVWSFDVMPQMPSGVTLIAPKNGSQLEPVNPMFEWWSPDPSVSYELHVARDSAFQFRDLDVKDARSRRRDTLEANTRYFWRVRAANAFESGPWSPAWSFLTGTTLPVLDEPALDEIRVDCSEYAVTITVDPEYFVGEMLHMRMYTLAGKEVLLSTVQRSSPVVRIPHQLLSIGSYVVIVTTEAGTSVARLVYCD